ncbi:hypothetical protein ABID08_000618 [Rhizobium binae]|uniref:Uncharacterized protein n=1 Tax=Rhizobium binae TaxID=1138190 RepID=A0ABV2M9Y2_9HYPH
MSDSWNRRERGRLSSNVYHLQRLSLNGVDHFVEMS